MLRGKAIKKIREYTKLSMDKINPSSSVIPTVTLSSFMDGGDETERKTVTDTIYEACTKFGVFMIEHDGVPLERCEKLLELNAEFFGFPDEVKKQCHWDISGNGYGKYEEDKYHDFEYLLMRVPDRYFSGVPAIQPHYWETYEEVYNYLVKTSAIVQDIINDGLGLPPNVLKNKNKDRCWDFLMPMHYTPTDGSKNIGIIEHLDPSLFTIILQNDVCGLEFFKDGEWIDIFPKKGTMTVIMSDLIQVLSNKKIKTVPHRAFKHKEGKRLAIDFCYNYGPYNKVEPLPAFAEEIGVKPKYIPFINSQYTELIRKDYITPPESADGFTKISHFETEEEKANKTG